MWGRQRVSKRWPRTSVVVLALALVLALGGLALVVGAPRGPVVHTIALDARPDGATFDPTGRYAFIPTYTIDPQTQNRTSARLAVLDLRRASLVRAVDVGIDPQATAFDARRRHFIVAGTNALALVNIRTGGVATVPLPASMFDPLIVDDQRDRFYGVDNSTAGISAGLDIFDARTGRLVRTLHLTAASVMQASLIAFAFGPSVLDVHTGRLFLTMPRRRVCTFTRTSGGRCVLTGPPGRLYMLDTGAGGVLRRLAAGADPGWMTLDEKAGCVLAQSYAASPSPTASGTLRVFDALTGALRWQAPLGPQNAGRYAVVDDATGRVYLVDRQGSIALIDPGAGRVSASETALELALAAPQSGSVSVTITHGHVVAVRDNGTDVPPSDPLGWLPGQIRHLLPWRPPRPRTMSGSVSIFDAP
jgi:DNA-binding beta-propeller fold protein YncE